MYSLPTEWTLQNKVPVLWLWTTLCFKCFSVPFYWETTSGLCTYCQKNRIEVYFRLHLRLSDTTETTDTQRWWWWFPHFIDKITLKTVESEPIIFFLFFRCFDGPLPAGWMETRCWRSKCTTTAKSFPTGKVYCCSQRVLKPHLPHLTAFQRKTVCGFSGPSCLPVTACDQFRLSHAVCSPAEGE